MKSKIVIWLATGLIIGLVLVALVGVFFIPQLLNNAGTDQVQVSGNVRTTQTGIIVFSAGDGSFYSSCPIAGGQYRVVLEGGESYNVTIKNNGVDCGNYSLYIPTGVTTFEADF